MKLTDEFLTTQQWFLLWLIWWWSIIALLYNTLNTLASLSGFVLFVAGSACGYGAWHNLGEMKKGRKKKQ